MDLKDRTALVTGGAIRVGGAISAALARAGARVVVHFNSSGFAADELVARIRGEGGEAAPLGADLSSMDGVRALIDSSDQPFGPIDLLINNASIFPPERLAEVDEQLWESVMGINLRAPFFLTQQLGGRMKSRGSGVIINLADLAGIQAWTGYAAHSISKAGLIHLTRIAARALAPEVRVSAITPGTVLPPDDLSEEEIDRLAARAPLKRNGSPGDVVGAVMYLIAAEFVTGEVMVVDGGRMLR